MDAHTTPITTQTTTADTLCFRNHSFADMTSKIDGEKLVTTKENPPFSPE
jgi:hypothetical protein